MVLINFLYNKISLMLFKLKYSKVKIIHKFSDNKQVLLKEENNLYNWALQLYVYNIDIF